MVIVSMWASMAGWLTPTVLFCVTNLIIATIFIASNNNDKHHNHGDSLSRAGRVSSFIERARSINLRSYTTTVAAAGESQPYYPSQPETATYGSSSRLAQSIHSSSSYVTPPESTEIPQPELELSQSGDSAPSLFQRVKSIKLSSFYSENTSQTESEPVLNRSPSFLDRVKSFELSSIYKSGSSTAPPENVDMDSSHNPGQDHHVIRSKSEKASTKKSVVEMKKSRSEVRIAPDDEEDVDMRRPATARERWNVVADEEVDAKADYFITRFRQQLKLQRLESLVRYNQKVNGRA